MTSTASDPADDLKQQLDRDAKRLASMDKIERSSLVEEVASYWKLAKGLVKPEVTED